MKRVLIILCLFISGCTVSADRIGKALVACHIHDGVHHMRVTPWSAVARCGDGTEYDL